MRAYRLFFIGLVAAPANAGMTVVDFKYNSLTHLGFNGSVAQTAAQPAEAADLIASFLRANGASVTTLEESSVRLFQTPSDADCERWSHSIFQAEIASFKANKLNQYKKIDRTAQPAGCSVPKSSWLQYGYSTEEIAGGSGYRITAVADRSVKITQGRVRPVFSAIFGTYSTTNMWSMVPSTIQKDVNFETHFEVLLWRGATETKTTVFVLASPTSDGVVPAPNHTIGYAHHRLADGAIESVAARNLLTFVIQKDIASSSGSSGEKGRVP